MKKKLIILTLCFTIITSSVNFKKVYAMDFVITPTLLATLATVAVGSGIILTNQDDIVDIGRMFYDRHKENWESVNTLFDACVSIGKDKVVSVGQDFLDLCTDFFDNVFSTNNSTIKFVDSLPIYPTFVSLSKNSTTEFGSTLIKAVVDDSGIVAIYYGSSQLYTFKPSTLRVSFSIYSGEIMTHFYDTYAGLTYTSKYINHSIPYNNSYSIPYTGTYDKSKVVDKVVDGSLSLPVPGDLSNLVGENVDVWNPSYDLPVDGVISIPTVDNPSISIDGTTTFPLDDTIADTDTGSSVWDKIKDFIISLVVPSDTFWTDTFGGLRNSFNDAFPMVDMSNFNNLIVGGKPFPNIYITVFGSRAKVVDGDVINSIVDWLKPLVAGFMMLCLMLYNYRKIYKLIRNTEPFGPIAPGTSDFRTGLSPTIDLPGSSAPSNYEIARDQLRDVAFEMRTEILSRKHRGEL